jgi:hypothetical protein
MTFTDNDVKRLKESVEKAIANGYSEPHDFSILALLNRLEAAENVCAFAESGSKSATCQTLKAWRKSAGK